MLKRRGLVGLKEFAGAGVSDVAVRRLVGSGTAERVERGVYGLSDRDPSDLETLARVSLKMPRSVVCLLSAARLHELTTANPAQVWVARSEEHTSELQSLMRISYAVFCLKK